MFKTRGILGVEYGTQGFPSGIPVPLWKRKSLVPRNAKLLLDPVL
jgi:hypothetical protein